MPKVDLDKIISSLTDNQRMTIVCEFEGGKGYSLARCYLPGKWISMHADAVRDGIIKRGLTRPRTEAEITAAFAAGRSIVCLDGLNDLGEAVARRLIELRNELGHP